MTQETDSSTAAPSETPDQQQIDTNACLVLTHADRRISVLDAASGEVIWTKPLQEEMLKATVGDGYVLIHPTDTYADDGITILELETGEERAAFLTEPELKLIQGPLCVGETIYIVDSRKRLRAFSAKSGEPVWSYDLPESDDPHVPAILRTLETFVKSKAEAEPDNIHWNRLQQKISSFPKKTDPYHAPHGTVAHDDENWDHDHYDHYYEPDPYHGLHEEDDDHQHESVPEYDPEAHTEENDDSTETTDDTTDSDDTTESTSESTKATEQSSTALATSSSSSDDNDEEEEGESGGGRMTFMEHLLELRGRLIVSLASIVVMMVLSAVFHQEILGWLRAPIDNVNTNWNTDEALLKLKEEKNIKGDVAEVISTKPMATMMIFMKVILFAGLILGSPVVVLQAWRFVSPGLKDSEQRAIKPVLYFGILFFLGGASFCYYLVFPIMLDFLVWFDVILGVRVNYTLFEFIHMLLAFMLICGLIFEMPLVFAILARIGIVRPGMLTKFWRMIVTLCFIAGSLISPGGEPMSMLIMSIALVLLYGASILAVKIFYGKRIKQLELEEAELEK